MLTAIAYSFLNLFFPPLCIHCKHLLHSKEHFLCETCLTLLSLIEVSERCSKCFSTNFCLENKRCDDCLINFPILDGFASAFEYEGPPASLISHLKYGDQPYLAKGCSGYLAAQFLNLGWPFPDIIVPVPMSRMRKWARGYNQSVYLAKELSIILQKPMKEVLIRKSGEYSQAGRTKKQRMTLEASHFYFDSHFSIEDKIVLLVDDVVTTGTTIRNCAQALFAGHPAKIYGLTLCKA